jgi:hypothetical protein
MKLIQCRILCCTLVISLLGSCLTGTASENFETEVKEEERRKTTILKRNGERLMQRIELDSNGDGDFDRLIESFYVEKGMVFTYSHFKPAPPGRMFSSMGKTTVMSGSMGVDDPREVLIISSSESPNFFAFVLEGGKHRLMTSEESKAIQNILSQNGTVDLKVNQ